MLEAQTVTTTVFYYYYYHWLKDDNKGLDAHLIFCSRGSSLCGTEGLGGRKTWAWSVATNWIKMSLAIGLTMSSFRNPRSRIPTQWGKFRGLGVRWAERGDPNHRNENGKSVGGQGWAIRTETGRDTTSTRIQRKDTECPQHLLHHPSEWTTSFWSWCPLSVF